MKINTATLKTLIFDLKEKIIGNRITTITLINSRVFLISFSTYRKEKLLVCLDHQNPFISLCEVNDSISTITGGLSDVLRKELKEAIILDISLINEDRVVDFSLSKTNDYFEKENKHLILELIPFRSNLILLDKDGLISYAAHYSSLENNRPIIRGMSYIFIPKSDSFKKEEEIIPLEEIRLHANEYIYKAKEKRLLEKYDVLFKFIKTRIKSLKAKLTVLDNEYQNAEKKLVYQEIGSNLLAFINEKELLEQYIKDNNLDIDRNIPIGQVANLYFKKYKKAKRTLSINREEKEKAIKEIEYLEVINSQVQYMDEEDLYELAKEIMPHKFKANKQKEKINKISYVNVGSTKIMFGKNHKQNEEISFHLAKKDHYYFHIKDYHGSHVVICSNNPTNEEKLIAAEMCLILSNKTAGEIQYSKVKNIKKGPEPGQALLNKYELIVLHEIRPSTYELLKKHH